jgi:hypothetical protein
MTFILLAMFFCHIIDDFCLQQSFLANGKQREWWIKNVPDEKYRRDYVMCLIIHSLSWAFAVMLPIAWKLNFEVGDKFAGLLVLNAIVHAVIDDLKANKRALNLIQDQCLHFAQIIATFLAMLGVMTP